jgi:hypothetical protein
MPFTDRLLSSDGDVDRSEAAWQLFCHAHDADDWRLLADALDVSGTETRWSIPRAAHVVLASARSGEGFSANKLRRLLPERAWPLIPGTLKALALQGLIRATDQTERSTAPGSRGWRVALYRLTQAGEELAGRLAPTLQAGEPWMPETGFADCKPLREAS